MLSALFGPAAEAQRHGPIIEHFRVRHHLDPAQLDALDLRV